MFGHNRTVNEKVRQIDELNRIIFERKNQKKELEEIIERLNATIAAIIRENPGVGEVEPLEDYLASLKREIGNLEKELKAMKISIGITDELIDIKYEREKLEKERQDLLTYQKTSYKPTDIIICAYTVPNIDGIAIDAFIFKRTYSYKNPKFRGERTGTLYTTLSGGRTIGFTSDYEDFLICTNSPDFNAIPQQFVTFEEACLAIGSDLYLRDQVSALEIHSILQQFRSGFNFYGKTNITMEEFLSIVKSGIVEYNGSIELDSLAPKGETR